MPPRCHARCQAAVGTTAEGDANFGALVGIVDGMIPTTGPEDPDAVGDGPRDEGEAESDSVKGWVSPEERPWVHPSEVGFVGRAVESAIRSLPRDSGRRRAIGPVAAVALLVVAAGGVGLGLFLSEGTRSVSASPPATSELMANGTVALPGHTRAGGSLSRGAPLAVSAGVLHQVAALRPYVVAVEVPDGAGSTWGSGVVVARSGPTATILTSTSLFAGSRSSSQAAGRQHVTVVDRSGTHLSGRVTALDATTGVALVKVHSSVIRALEKPSFDPVIQGEITVAVACDGSPGDLQIALGRVSDVGQHAAVPGHTMLLDAISVDAPVHGADGGIVIDGNGRLVGILDATERVHGRLVDYVTPAPLAWGVAGELMANGRVDHGWLGVALSDAGGEGARVVSVGSGSPAAVAGIHPGDVIVGVDGTPTPSMAALQASLYLMPPHSAVVLSVRGSRGRRDVPVVLAAS